MGMIFFCVGWGFTPAVWQGVRDSCTFLPVFMGVKAYPHFLGKGTKATPFVCYYLWVELGQFRSRERFVVSMVSAMLFR